MKQAFFTPGLVLNSILVAGLGLAGTSFAQYQWRDANGNMIISDQPPPASVKPSQIIKSAPLPKAAPAPVPAASTAKPADSKAPLTLAEKDQAFKKRQQEKAEADKSTAEKQAAAEQKAKYCEELATKMRTLQSGMRITQVDKSGETRMMENADREKEMSTTSRDIASKCG